MLVERGALFCNTEPAQQTGKQDPVSAAEPYGVPHPGRAPLGRRSPEFISGTEIPASRARPAGSELLRTGTVLAAPSGDDEDEPEVPGERG